MTKHVAEASWVAATAAAVVGLAALLAVACKTTAPASATKDASPVGTVSEAAFASQCGGAGNKVNLAWYAPKIRPFITDADVEDCISADLNAFGAANLLVKTQIRYLTLTHLYNAGDAPDDIARYRAGISKLLNSLSYEKAIKRPVIIDPAGTIVRLLISDYGWDADKWTLIFPVAAQSFPVPVGAAELTPAYPFRKILGKVADLDKIYGRGDFFVAKASVPPLYHSLLDMPNTDLDLETKILGTPEKLETDIQQGQIIRSGFNNSGVSANNRLLERHDSAFGAYWKSYDFPDSSGVHNFFVNPFGPCFRVTQPKPLTDQTKPALFKKCSDLATDNDFLTNKVYKQGGGEIIYNLPNKLQAYLLINAVGNRISIGPANIVSNASDKLNNFQILNGQSCMFCHFGGMIASKPDQLGATITSLSGASNIDWFKTVAAQDLQVFAQAAFQPKALDDATTSDSKAFVAAEADAVGPDVKVGTNVFEPVNAANRRYQQIVTTAEAAAELGLAAGDFIAGIENADIADVDAKQQLLQFTTVDADGMSRVDFETFFPKFAAVMANLKQAAKPNANPVPPGQAAVTPKWQDVTPGGGCSANPANCMFQDANSGLTITKNGAAQPWDGATAACSSLQLGGLTGWRLPSITELIQLNTDGVLTLASSTFVSASDMGTQFWSSTPLNNDVTVGTPASGVTTGDFKTANHLSFCVITVATAINSSTWKDVTPNGSCATNAANCSYKDLVSGLTIVRNGAAQPWDGATAACAASQASGVTGWRLPTITELVQMSKDGVSTLASPAFVSATDMATEFWSSTPLNNDVTVGIPASGVTTGEFKASSHLSFCVQP